MPRLMLTPRRAVLRAAAAGGAYLLLRPRSLLAHAGERDPEVAAGESINARMTGDIAPVHDPCLIKEGGTYYLYGTSMPGSPGITLHTSPDLVHWTSRGAIFNAVPSWAAALVPGTQGMWAPDVSVFGGGYRLYYAVSTFGSNRSVIGLATNTTLDPASPKYHWQDHGLVLMSHEGGDFNAIDPNHFVDGQGRSWLIYGSFWGGIRMRRLDPTTGKPAPGDPHAYPLARRPEPTGAPDPIEGAFMFQRGGYYYLFASYDYCCKGVRSTYYTAYGRSREVTGPFVGRDGGAMLDGRGTVILRADLKERQRWRGPGGCGVVRDGDREYIVYHAYDAWHHGIPTLRIAPLSWSSDGWPTADTD
ncbi:MAG TPA: arabinan endo-1,5-alpha-L-arabinosidase [Steroidobacteraceae bacterium]|nr:arabinan endo-1,5-alpha-L-arabinosidase [Steroidobacteraceae bacterium]